MSTGTTVNDILRRSKQPKPPGTAGAAAAPLPPSRSAVQPTLRPVLQHDGVDKPAAIEAGVGAVHNTISAPHRFAHNLDGMRTTVCSELSSLALPRMHVSRLDNLGHHDYAVQQHALLPLVSSPTAALCQPMPQSMVVPHNYWYGNPHRHQFACNPDDSSFFSRSDNSSLDLSESMMHASKSTPGHHEHAGQHPLVLQPLVRNPTEDLGLTQPKLQRMDVPQPAPRHQYAKPHNVDDSMFFPENSSLTLNFSMQDSRLDTLAHHGQAVALCNQQLLDPSLSAASCQPMLESASLTPQGYQPSQQPANWYPLKLHHH